MSGSTGFAGFLSGLGINLGSNTPAPEQINPENNPANEGETAPVVKPQGGTAQNLSDLDLFSQIQADVAGAKPEVRPEFALDPTKLNEAASKMNFTAGIDAELLQKAMSGQDQHAFMQVLNTVAQNSFKTAIDTTGKLAGEHTKNALEFERSQMKKEFVTSAATSNIDLNAHPLLKEQVKGIAATLSNKFPNANPKDIANQALNIALEQAKELLKASGQEVVSKTPEQQQQETQQKASDVDWNDWWDKAQS